MFEGLSCLTIGFSSSSTTELKSGVRVPSKVQGPMSQALCAYQIDLNFFLKKLLIIKCEFLFLCDIFCESGAYDRNTDSSPWFNATKELQLLAAGMKFRMYCHLRPTVDHSVMKKGLLVTLFSGTGRGSPRPSPSSPLAGLVL